MREDRIETILSGLDDRYICEAVRYMGKKKDWRSRVFRKAKAAAAGFIVFSFLSVSGLSLAAASGNIPAYDILYALHPEAAKLLTPVKVSCEDNGIRMEVEAVYVHGDTAEIYISMTDLTGNRIDGTTDLFDSYEIHIPEDSIGTCSRIDYEQETNTATFLISVRLMNQKKISGQKLTFRVSQFLSGKKETEEELTEISLETAGAVSKLQRDVEERGGSWIPGEEEEISEFLIENEKQSYSPTDGVKITAWGFADGRLHIQAYYEDILRTDNHGDIYLADEQGNRITCVRTTAFWDDSHTGSYEEYVFDVTPETDISGFAVRGHFWTCKDLTTGKWQVSFPIENRE